MHVPVRVQKRYPRFCDVAGPWCALVLCSLILISSIGCGTSPMEFRPNDLHAASLLRESGDESPNDVAEKAAQVVEQWFGALDSPRWPDGIVVPDQLAAIVDMDHVTRSAGPVGRLDDKIERGLYRKHCVACHGLTGDGRGAAAALLAPYPRDFRRGTFKFKSTPAGFKPTRDDTRNVLNHGIPGTAMPSFASLSNSEEFAHDVDSLIEYVRFLAIRGEVERKLISKSIREGLELRSDSEDALQIARDVAQRWRESEGAAIVVPEPPTLEADGLADSIRRGKDLYASEITACVKCHGTSGLGDGASQDYDEWTKDWTILSGIDPKSKIEWKEMKPFGALKPVIDRPRNFAWKSYRGGNTPNDIFRRLVLGIEGTPMPPIARAHAGNPGLTDDQIWDLVHFVLSIQGES